MSYKRKDETIMDELTLKVKYLSPDIPKLQITTNGDWIDVYSAKSLFIKHHQHVLIPLGFALQLPEGYEAHLAPRSSLFKKTGLIVTNSVGVIDESYCGDDDEWKLAVYCLFPVERNKHFAFADGSKKTYTGSSVMTGDKIAQFRIMKKMPPVRFEEVEHLENPSRGGFGSTGGYSN